MDDIEEPTFSENTQAQSDFILPPSQKETQQESQVEKQMNKILKNLPALQNPDKIGGLSEAASDTCTDEEQTKEKVSILASDTDSVRKMDAHLDHSDHSDIISDSDSDSVTAIEDRLQDDPTCSQTGIQSQGHAEKRSRNNSKNSQSNDSSFQSRNRSNLGSYDQCEVYKTQQGHVKGDRFDLLPASQDDMFAETGDSCNIATPAKHLHSLTPAEHLGGLTPEEDLGSLTPAEHLGGLTPEEDLHSLTPAEHLRSLHLSQNPMLIPETVEESLNEIPPSPGLYVSTPIIIPSSPTAETGDQSSDGNQTMFDINAVCTLASQPQDDSYHSSSKQEETGDKLSEKQILVHSSQNSGAAVQGVGIVECGTSESMELHLSAATLVTHYKSVEIIDVENVNVRQLRSERCLHPPQSSQRLYGTKSYNEENDVIVIPSGSGLSYKEVEESQNLSLHMSPSGYSITQGQSSKDMTSEFEGRGSQVHSTSQNRSQRLGSQPKSQSVKKQSHKSKMAREIEKINDNPLIEWRNESDTERQQALSEKCTDRFSDEFHLALPGEGVMPAAAVAMETDILQSQGVDPNTLPQAAQQSERPSASDDTDKVATSSTANQLQSTAVEQQSTAVEQQSTAIEQQSTAIEQQSTAIEQQSIANQLQSTAIKQQSTAIEQQFIAAQQQFTTDQQQSTADQRQSLADEQQSTADQQLSIVDQQQSTSNQEQERVSGLDDTIKLTTTADHGQENLSIGMIQSESEPTELMFRLQKPDIQESSLIEENEEVFPMAKKKQRGHARYILEDSDEECIEDKSGSNIDCVVDGPREDILLAEKLDTHLVVESVDMTQCYDANVTIESNVNDDIDKQKFDIEDNVDPSSVADLSPTMSDGHTRRRRLTESCTQTADDKPVYAFESVDASVVQKVAEYLQSGYSSRSRTSSTCTDLSDLHGDGSEKGDNFQKTPQRRKDRSDKAKISNTLSRRESADQRTPKSPKEIQNIIKTYSNILKKKHKHDKHRDKLSDDKCIPSSQRPNPAENDADRAGPMVARRMSSQSLPEELLRVKSGSQTLVSLTRNSSQSGACDLWLTARKPESQVFVESDGKSDRISEVNSPRKELSQTGVTQDLSKSFRPESVNKKTLEQASARDIEHVVSGLDGYNSDHTSRNMKYVHKASDSNNRTTVECEKKAKSVHMVLESNNENNTCNLHIPTGAENEDFVHSKETLVAAPNNQQKMSLRQSESFIVLEIMDEEIIANQRNTTQMKTPGRITPVNKTPATTTPDNTTPSITTPVDTTPVKTRPTKSKPYYTKSSRNKKKAKRRLSAEKRNELRRVVDSPSPQTVSGVFVSSSQKFAPSHQNEGHDTYSFHGTQSQNSPEEPRHDRPASTPGKTPLSSRKRQRIQHKKSGLKKARHETAEDIETGSHVSFKTSPRISSQSSDATVTTIGSLPSIPSSIPSSISQSSPVLDTVVSPSSSGSGRQSVSEEISNRLSGKRMSLDQALSDTLPLTHSEEDNYQRVTVVIERVERVYREITTTRKVIGDQGQVLENTQDVKRLDPVVVEENTHKKVQYVYIPSPSRSVSSLTSGDLADISSSLSRSSASSGSLGSKVGSFSSSQDRTAGSAKHLETQTSLDQSEAVNADQGHIRAQQSSTKVVELSSVDNSNTAETMAAPLSIPKTRPHRTSLVEKTTENQLSTPEHENQQHSLDAENQPIHLTGVRPRTPDTVRDGNLSDKQTPGPSTEGGAQSKQLTPALHSDQEGSDVQTPLGSTINKTNSYLHSRTSSVESPKASDSLFSTSSDDNKKSAIGIVIARQKSSEESSTDNSMKPGGSSEQISSEILYQDQYVSSSSTPEEQVAMVTSTGTIGSRVMAKWKDGFYYPGTLKSSSDRYSKHQVRFDDGDSLGVKATDILLIERLPVGQSVMVLTDAGDFECGLVTKPLSDHYIVETDEGTSGRYTFGQVILSADQAAFIISDRGSDVVLQIPLMVGLPANVGDLSLENLVDTPRRSSKKTCVVSEVKVEEEGQGHSGQGRKRKFESLKPQATSTPTPKGKTECALGKRKRVGRLMDSPVRGFQASPVAMVRSPKKSRVGLFGKDLGPIPTKKIFRNIYFLLTNVEKTKEQQEQEKKLLQDSSLDTSTDESAVEEEMCSAFDKEHLKHQIEEGGGTLLENIEEKLVSTCKKRIVLLSSSYQRTIKYLQCLACGIPCLSHMWIVDSCTQGHQLDDKSYILPAGISLERRKIMEWKKKNDVFDGIKVVVYSKNNKFVESWSQILIMAKGHVHSNLQYTDVHVIVTDNSCTTTVERQAETHSVPLVGTEWVIQSLINGRVMSYNGHPRYRHDIWI